MRKQTMQHCDWCGADIGVGVKYPGDLESCGEKECEREVRAMRREWSERDAERFESDGGFHS